MQSLRGKLLLASPTLEDPNFFRSVVLITEHNEQGAMGVILNRPSETAVAEAVPELAWVAGDPDGEPIFVGGPVAPNGVMVLAEFVEPEAAAITVLGDVGFVPADVADPDGFAPLISRARVFAGHAGWGPGQLEDEMLEESWIVGAALPDDVFAEEADELWSGVLRRMGRRYALLATMPFDPSLN